MPMTTEDLLVTTPSLCANDRCDRCSGQAYTLWAQEGSELFFCAHHTREHEPVLLAQGFVLHIDERDRLIEESHG